MTREEFIKLAEVILKRTFNSPSFPKTGLEVNKIYEICKGSGVTRGHLKEARKRLGIISENRSGIQYWYLPEEEREQR